MQQKILYTLFLGVVSACVCAQPISLQRIDTIAVWKNNLRLAYPWCGGINFAQFSNADLNFDGVNDIVVFDREGNRILTFCHSGLPSSTQFFPCPEYANAFPDIYGWMLMTDYNQDGKADIFHYWNGGVKVYKQVGNASTGPVFELANEQLKSFYTYSTMPLYISAADIPAIEDIDGDGDLDILTFHFMGGCVEYHKNQSVELYGHADSLIFRLSSDNWGLFREGSFSYDIHLNDSCDAPGTPGGWRHSGSTLLAIDIDQDLDKDLVLGDIDGNHLSLLRNDGTSSFAQIGFVDAEFPKNNHSTLPVQLDLFPAAYYVDVNNDNVRDLIVCPNTTDHAETRNSVWHYQNHGTNSQPEFVFMENNFLQGEMIEFGLGAYPVWVDYNLDGLMDLVVGNAYYWNGHAQLALYKNTGTPQQPSFTLITQDYAGLSALQLSHIVPAFADMDADGDMDMLIGDISGYLHYFENIAAVLPGMQALFASPQMQYHQIKEQAYSAPFIADLNGDNLPDIICGNRAGKLNYYQNIGTATNPQFATLPHIANLGGVSVHNPQISNFGHSIPHLFMYQGQWNLAVGSYSGEIAHYYILHDINHQLLDDFTLIQNNMGFLKPGTYSSPALYDINNDGFPDLVTGNRAGGLNLFFGSEGYAGIPLPHIELSSTLWPNPAQESVTIEWPDRLFDMYVYDMAGRLISCKENIFQSNTFSLVSFQSGMYLVRLVSGQYHLFHKLIVQP